MKYDINKNILLIINKNFYKIDNTNISAEDVAKIIKEKFEL
jgi:hypothetical protein